MPQFLREVAGQHFDGAFQRPVNRRPGHGEAGEARRQVHDLAAVDDQRQHFLRQEEDALEMDVRQPVEVVFGRLGERHVQADAGIVDQVIDRLAAEAGLEGFAKGGRERIEGGDIAGIDLKRRCFAAQCLDLVDGRVGLGLRRLSIIDLSPQGSQPMQNEDGTVQVVFNGEIYNYRELRARLQDRGHQFRTNSDTEVIVHGYKEWGADVLHHLNGMFGLAIWDVAKERLVVARDAMGIKLIYYRLQNGQLTFGSEIRAVRAADERAS